MESPNPNDKSEIEFMQKNDFIYNETGSDDRIMSGASKNNQEKLINFEVDEVLNKIGGFGKWQWLNFILLSLPSAVSGFILLTFSFTGFKPEKYRCAVPECDQANSTFNFGSQDIISKLRNKSIFVLHENGEVDYCNMYPYDPLSVTNTKSRECSLSSFNLDAPPIKCDVTKSTVIHAEFAMKSSIVTEFGLFCDEEYKIALTGTIYMLGLFIGAVLLGRLSDVLGRRITITLSILLAAIAQIAGGLAQNWPTYAITRFFAGIVVYGSFGPAFNLMLEIVEPNYKTRVGMGLNISFALGCSAVGLAAWLIPDWRNFHYITSVPIFVMCLVHFIIPESPRWLLAKQRYKDLYRLIRKIAKMNKVAIPIEIETSLLDAMAKEPEMKSKIVKKSLNPFCCEEKSGDKESKSESHPTNLFINPTLRTITLVLFADWAIVVLGYYGISMASSKLGTNSFVSTVAAALTEVPAYLFVMLVMDHWGRKPTCCFSFMLTGIICIPSGYASGNLQLVLALLGKFGASAAFALMYLYTVELYPTELRGTGLGFCAMMARVGGFVAPQVALLLRKDLAMIVMGVCSLIGGMLTLLLPETLGTTLCEKIEDLEDLKRDGKPFFKWWTKRKLQAHLDSVIQRNGTTTTIKEEC